MFAHLRLRSTAALVATLLIIALGSPLSAATAPPSATGLKATPSSSSANLSWNASSGATSYGVCLSTSEAATTCAKWFGGLTTTSLTVKDLAPTGGTDYFFTVLSYKGSLFSRSAKVGFNLTTPGTVPGTPSGLKAATTTTGANLTWTAASGAKYYGVCIYKHSTDTSCAQWNGNITSTSLTLINIKSQSGTDYYFTVLAYNDTGNSRSDKAGFDLRPGTVTGATHSISTSAVTISWPQAANAEKYSVCLLTNDTTTTCVRTSSASSATSATFTGLGTTPSTDWYYIVRAVNGSQTSATSRVGFNLPVGGVSGFSVTDSTTNSIHWIWNSLTNAENYQIQVATSSDMTKGLITYYPTGTSYDATKLVPGTTYYFRIRGVNGSVLGTYTTVGTLHLSTAPISVDVLTYNLCGQDKCLGSDNVMKHWSPTRKPLAGALVRTTASDIIATQESGDKDTNFITELPGFGKAMYKSGKMLFYKTSRYTLLRTNYITLSSANKRYAVWAELQDKATRTRFIVADAHTSPTKGKYYDDLRKAETTALLSGVKSINTAHLPVIYAGDYNSNKSNLKSSGGYDAPLQVMAQAGIPDSRNIADWAWHTDYNSANQAINPPYRYGDQVDHIFVTAGISVQQWGVVTSLDSKGNYKTPFPSDHNPVRSIMTLPGNP